MTVDVFEGLQFSCGDPSDSRGLWGTSAVQLRNVLTLEVFEGLQFSCEDLFDSKALWETWVHQSTFDSDSLGQQHDSRGNAHTLSSYDDIPLLLLCAQTQRLLKWRVKLAALIARAWDDCPCVSSYQLITHVRDDYQCVSSYQLIAHVWDDCPCVSSYQLIARMWDDCPCVSSYQLIVHV